MVKFIADSSCNITQLDGVTFESVPMIVYTSEKTYTDDPNCNTTEMLDYMSTYKGRSYTSCPNIELWTNSFEGADEIYIVTLTSALSGTYNAAMAAKEQYLQDHPDVKIEVFDSRSTGPEMVMILEKLVQLHKEGLSFEEICTQTHAYMSTTRMFFSLASLHNLAENGRVNKVIASAIGVLGINIIATASEAGEIKPISKCRGESKAVMKLYHELISAGYKGGKVRMCHVENEGFAQKVAEQIRSNFPDADIAYGPSTALCSFYAERNGLLVAHETN